MNLTGNIIDYFTVFLAGIIGSFTPCAYPLIPITAGFIAGINHKGTKLMGFLLSLLYVLGIAITYSTLAIFAALTGKVFGQIQSNSFVYFIVAGILLILSLEMLDIIHFPYLNLNLQGKIRKRNALTIILFGMVSGLTLGPCISPILGVLLLYVGSKQNIFHGIGLMLVFSYGLGFSLILVGTFSSILSKMPKSGNWLNNVRKICGTIILLASLYFLKNAIMFLK